MQQQLNCQPDSGMYYYYDIFDTLIMKIFKKKYRNVFIVFFVDGYNTYILCFTVSCICYDAHMCTKQHQRYPFASPEDGCYV